MNELLKTALVGTGKAPGIVAPAGAADALAASLEVESAEQALLLRAGAGVLYRTAGLLPNTLEALPPAPEDTRPPCPRSVVEAIRLILREDYGDVLPEVLEVMDRAGLRVAPEVLPELLSLSDPQLRALIKPVLGHRGEWLAAMNPEWAWAAPNAALPEEEEVQSLRTRWDDGTLEERIETLRRLRELRPDEAHAWLQEAMAGEKADRRAKLVEPLEVSLSPDDEPFLESVLEDRSEAVRVAAARLLARLPDSAYRARMLARADAMFEGERSGWLSKKTALKCTPPENIDKDWTRDGISSKPPTGMGPKAWWTTLVMSAVDLGHWEERLKVTPQDLLAAAKQTDYADNILIGWLQSAYLHLSSPTLDGRNAHKWIPALWEQAMKNLQAGSWYERDGPQHVAASLLAHLPQEEAEDLVLAEMERQKWKNVVGFRDVATRLNKPWSPRFTKTYLKRLAKGAAGAVYGWIHLAGETATFIPEACFDEALEVAAEALGKLDGSLRRPMTQFAEIIRIRKTILEEMPCER